LKLFTILPLIAFLRLAQGDNEKVVEYDTFRVTGRLRDGRPFELAIFREPYNRGRHRNIKCIGGDGSELSHVVSALTLTIAGRNAEIPRSQYEDLGDPHVYGGTYLMQDEHAVYLYVSGSDGAGAYTACFTISDGKLTKRAIKQPD
jgi:hypothetical protein